MNLTDLRNEIKKESNPQKAKNLAWFFKTGKGEYGEGDFFVGLTVPQCRKIAIRFSDIRLEEVQKLMESKIHEERMIALLILIDKYSKTNHKKIVLHFLH